MASMNGQGKHFKNRHCKAVNPQPHTACVPIKESRATGRGPSLAVVGTQDLPPSSMQIPVADPNSATSGPGVTRAVQFGRLPGPHTPVVELRVRSRSPPPHKEPSHSESRRHSVTQPRHITDLWTSVSDTVLDLQSGISGIFVSPPYIVFGARLHLPLTKLKIEVGTRVT